MTEAKKQEDNQARVLLPEEHQYRFPAGQTIATRYRVEKALGFGGFSEVYLCIDARLNRQVALKVIPRERLTGEVLTEAQTAAGLIHNGIIQVYDVAETDKDPFFISMQYVSGGTLQARLDEAEYQRLPLGDQVLKILADVAAALDYAHTRGVLHRDVKPSNILLSEEGRAILADFGLAKTKRLPGESAFSVAKDLSGTIPYMSPEQVSEKPVDQRSDIYALGVVAYQMLTGQSPYRGLSTLLIANIANTPPVPARIANSEIPEGVELVLQKVLSKEPQERYPTCGAFVEALRAAAQAYIDQAEQYTRAVELVQSQRWHDALDFLQQLERNAPGYKDVRLLIEQAKKQIQLQDLYARAENLLDKKDYQGCLDKLNAIAGLDSNYSVGTMREKAQAGLAHQQRESLDKQYQRALEQFKDKAYRACLDTLAIIIEQDPTYPDLEGLKPKAQDAWDREQHLTALYNSSQQHGQSDEWDQAVIDLETLHAEESDYSNIGNLLITARYMARLSGIWRQAQQFFKDMVFVDCVDALDKLIRIDREYKQQDVATMRQQAIERLYRQAVQQLQEEAFEKALQTVAAVGGRDPTYGDPENVAEKARRGIAARELKARLDGLYNEALEAFKVRQYERALEIWHAIHSEDPRYLDRLDVEGRARGAWCRQLDTEARAAYDEKHYAEASKAWDKIRDLDPDYRIPQAMYVQAQSRQKGLAGMLGKWFKKPVRQPKPEFVSELPVQVEPELEPPPVVEPKSRVESEPEQIPIPESAYPIEPQPPLTFESEPVEPEPEKRSKTMLPVWVWTWGALIVVAIVLLVGGWQLWPIIFPTPIPTWTATIPPTSTSTPNLTITAEYAAAENAKATATQEAITIAARQAVETATQVAKETVTQAAKETATQIAIPTLTQAAIQTATRSAMETTTAQPKPTQTLPPTPVPQAVANLASSVYECPDSSTKEVGVVMADESVPILGKADEQKYGNWLYVELKGGTKGFTYAPRFTYTADWNSLPVQAVTGSCTPVATATPTPRPGPVVVVTPGTLKIEHIWPSSRCNAGGGWTAYFEVKIKGGDGKSYTLYWDLEQISYTVKENEPDAVIIQRPGVSGMIVGTVRVVSGGQETSLQISARAPTTCK